VIAAGKIRSAVISGSIENCVVAGFSGIEGFSTASSMTDTWVYSGGDTKAIILQGTTRVTGSGSGGVTVMGQLDSLTTGDFIGTRLEVSGDLVAANFRGVVADSMMDIDGGIGNAYFAKNVIGTTLDVAQSVNVLTVKGNVEATTFSIWGSVNSGLTVQGTTFGSFIDVKGGVSSLVLEQEVDRTDVRVTGVTNYAEIRSGMTNTRFDFHGKVTTFTPACRTTAWSTFTAASTRSSSPAACRARR
ncbi:MAG: hypothetical protein GXP25_17840, partial [Planctomycetes bacterium]|nr:hypothetical protein [Planctomycetota bacterium]